LARFLNLRHFIVLPSHAPLLISVALLAAREALISIIKGYGTTKLLLPLIVTAVYLCYEIISIDKSGLVGNRTRLRYMVSFYWLVAAESFAFFSLLLSWFLKGSWAPSIRFARTMPSIAIPSALRLRLLNSALLLSSSVTVTYSHMSLSIGKYDKAQIGLYVTIFLRILFLRVQWIEFSISSLSISDRYYRSIVFASLRFHRSHVLVRVIFLSFASYFISRRRATSLTHPTYLCSVIYWHFVDVVWVFVYFSYYLAL